MCVGADIYIDGYVTKKRLVRTFMLNILGFAKALYTFNFGQFWLNLNIVNPFAHFNNCHCIKDTVYMYNKLLNARIA